MQNLLVGTNKEVVHFSARVKTVECFNITISLIDNTEGKQLSRGSQGSSKRGKDEKGLQYLILRIVGLGCVGEIESL